MPNQTLETESEGFQFTFSAPTIMNFTEPMTPPHGRSPSIELVKTANSNGSRTNSLGYVVTPPGIDYLLSLSYQPDGELESNLVSYSGSVSIVFNIVLVLFTRITHNHLECD